MVVRKGGPKHFFDGHSDPEWMAMAMWWALTRSETCHLPIRRPMRCTYMWMCLN